MPYTRISHTANGREAIEYALGGSEGKGHNDNNVRNLYITTVGMMYDPSERSYADQMAEYWKLASVKNTNQVRRIITSFSKDELDPEDPKSAIIAGEIARQHAIKYYPDRQVLICVQADGVGGCLHTHAIVNNVSMTDHKGCTDEQTKFHFVAKTIDAVAKEYTILSMDYKDKWDEVTGKAILPKDKVTQNVRRMKDANREASKDDESFYIWEEDLKHRIKQAMAEATSREDFEKRLTAHGVEIGRKGVSKKFGEYYTYELVDTTGFSEPPKKEPKVRSYNLGADYMPEAVDKMLVSKKHSRPEVKPEERPKAPEKTEADLKIEEDAKKFVAWCHENGYELSTNGKYDLDKADIAQKAYDEYCVVYKASDVFFHGFFKLF